MKVLAFLLIITIAPFRSIIAAGTIDPTSRAFDTPPNENLNRGENLNLFEGDIIPMSDEIKDDYGEALLAELRQKGILSKDDVTNSYDQNYLGGAQTKHLWTTRNSDVIEVPYEFDTDSFSLDQRSRIDSYLADLERATGVVKFIPKSKQENYIIIKDGTGLGCSSFVGNVRRGGQVLTLESKNCLKKGTVQHEFIHALGFYHEQSRPDRDEHVIVETENILDGKEINFRKRTESSIHGSTYDYGSVMHYPKNAFSKISNETTIIPKQDGVLIGQRREASMGDIEEIRLLYQCKSGPRTLARYKDKLCTYDCPCWDGAQGCNGDNECQGCLVCKTNSCHNPSDGSCNQNYECSKDSDCQGSVVCESNKCKNEIKESTTNATVTIVSVCAGALLIALLAGFGRKYYRRNSSIDMVGAGNALLDAEDCEHDLERRLD